MEINVVTLEDNKKYYEMAKIALNGNTYIILSEKDGEEIAVRKLKESLTSGKIVIEKLDTAEELNLVISEFIKKFN